MFVRLVLRIVWAAALSPVQAQGDVSLREFPFEFREGLIWVKVQVPQSPKPLNFLLDSGADASVINLPTARRLGLRLGQPVKVRGVGASTTGYWPQRLEARAEAVPLPRDYLAVDLNALSDACACPVDGLLGQDFFHGQVVEINFLAHKIRLLAGSSNPAAQGQRPRSANSIAH